MPNKQIFIIRFTILIFKRNTKQNKKKERRKEKGTRVSLGKSKFLYKRFFSNYTSNLENGK